MTKSAAQPWLLAAAKLWSKGAATLQALAQRRTAPRSLKEALQRLNLLLLLALLLEALRGSSPPLSLMP